MASKKTSRKGARPRPGGKARKPAGASRRPAAPAKKAVRPALKTKVVAKKSPAKPAGAERLSGPPPVPNAMGLESLHLDYTSHNLEEVRRFYTQQLGFTKFQWDPQWSYLWVQTSNGASLGFMPPMGGPPMMPREPNLYFLVADVDEAYRKLQTRGVSFEGPPEDKPWGHRVLITRDPEGRSIWIAQIKKPRS